MNKQTEAKVEIDTNADPITGEPGAHPVGTGLGAAGGGAAGAAIGSAAGPVGAVIGAAIGAVAGGYAGKGVAEAIDPTAEEAYWKGNYANEPYVKDDTTYEDYEPAYRTGYMGYGKHAGQRWDDVEGDLERDYQENQGASRLTWSDARPASRAAWDRVERALPGDARR